MYKYLFVMVFMLIIAIPLWPQAGMSEQAAADQSDTPTALIGLTIEEMLRRFGAPRSVYAVRGLEEWQDDVVFVYDEADFYILRDRVWKVGIRSAYRISAGDPIAAARLHFTELMRAGPDFDIFFLRGYNWPMAVRFNFNSAGRISAIFIYRTDI